MTARLSLYQKAEQELYKLDRSVKAKFYDFSHRFRENPHSNGLQLKALKGDSQIFSARIDDSYRALLTRTGTDETGDESWLVIAVRHRRDVYEQLSVAINRVSGEIEFVDLSVVGESALRRAGIQLVPAEPDATTAAEAEAAPASGPDAQPDAEPTAPATPLLAGHSHQLLRELGVAEPLIDLALTLTDTADLDRLVAGAPLLSQDVLYGLAAGMSPDEVRAEITAAVASTDQIDLGDFGAALARTTVTTIDDALQKVLEDGDFQAWKVFLHPTQARLVDRDYNGPARVSGGPGTGKTIVALHRIHHLVQQLKPGRDKPILLTTFTKNLTADLRARLTDLIGDPDLLARVEIAHIDELAYKVVSENSLSGRVKRRVDDRTALAELRTVLAELGQQGSWEPEFLIEEWEQVILGQSVATRTAYFQTRRAGRGRALTRPERAAVWKILDEFTARLDKKDIETWGQAAERAARYEMERAARIQARQAYKDQVGGRDLIHRDAEASLSDLKYRYKHIVVDEAQDLRAAHWKMLRAMVAPGDNDMFIAGDTHQRVYDNHVSLGSLGINVRGRSARLSLSYRTTKEILARALTVMSGETYDDLDDGTDTLSGYRSVLHGPAPELFGYTTWEEELDGLASTLRAWRDELATDESGAARDFRGLIAVAVPDRHKVSQVIYHLATKAGLGYAQLTSDGPRGDGEIHVGTMPRFKGLEYQRLVIVGASDRLVPRLDSIDRYRTEDPTRYRRELRKARSMLFVAATRARDALTITWHGDPSPFLAEPETERKSQRSTGRRYPLDESNPQR
ncbi:UvrD-helicase domain-containing protein [Streptomyces sp. VNUA24]|uniref:UvrD-helicase domain-containing protein n=1 Tax=Streptomyces sp. VNUA24 TaxID=3031131 RepID=UPI0023B84F3C|nr:UvrD-helicase domain-containing protein [Streptomyces sp. VNUA24]WEH16308.1 UvrD-helicase domain-containing protein [Streptomyces sp. VNUA24]